MQLSGGHLVEDETSCGPLCQHPSCWQSTGRQHKGIPKMVERVSSPAYSESDLPTLKICNMFDEYSLDSEGDHPEQFALHSFENRAVSLPEHQRQTSVRITATPAHTPVTKPDVEDTHKPKVKLVEVQEVFDINDLNSTWDDTFLPRQYYVWVPNPRKKKNRDKENAVTENVSLHQLASQGSQPVAPRDVTEQLIPQNIEKVRIENKGSDVWPVLKKKVTHLRSPRGTRQQPYSMSPRLRSGKPRIDSDGISELLDLPRDVLIQVLEHTKQSDFTSREKIREIISKFMPESDRGYSAVSQNKRALLKQRKMSIHSGTSKHVRQSVETKPVFLLDDEAAEESLMNTPHLGGTRDFASGYDSMKDMYFSVEGTRDFGKYKKPLPAIGHTGRLPFISLGLPELPSGVRQTKPFRYSKKGASTVDFSLGPVPTPPTSVRSNESVGSDHGTTMRPNVLSASDKSQIGSELSGREAAAPSQTQPGVVQQSTETSIPLHAVSPSFSTKVPQAPVTTPATHGKQSPTKTLPREKSLGSGAAASQDVPTRDTTMSPRQNIRAPTNSPREMSPETAGLKTIKEGGPEEGEKPASRRGVKFMSEVPEVPPPPSSPQDLEGDSFTDTASHIMTDSKVQSAQTREEAQSRPLTQPSSQGSGGKLRKPPFRREASSPCSPEPWPNIVEAEYDYTPIPPAKDALHSPHEGDYQTTPNTDMKSEQAVVTPGGTGRSRSDMSSEESQRSAIAKKLMEEGQKAESPAPPPPSPEQKEDGNDAEKRIKTPKSRSREAGAPMEALTEVSETASAETSSRTEKSYQKPGGKHAKGQGKSKHSPKDISPSKSKSNTKQSTKHTDTKTSNKAADGHVTEGESSPGRSESKTSVVQVAPKGKGRGKQITVETFVNIDIPANRDEKHDGSVSAEDKLGPELEDEEITEHGGDSEGFKQELRNELQKLSIERAGHQ